MLPYKLLYCFGCASPADTKLIQVVVFFTMTFLSLLALVLRTHYVSSVQILAWPRKYFGVILPPQALHSELLNPTPCNHRAVGK